jgi:hypothetical protein
MKSMQTDMPERRASKRALRANPSVLTNDGHDEASHAQISAGHKPSHKEGRQRGVRLCNRKVCCSSHHLIWVVCQELGVFVLQKKRACSWGVNSGSKSEFS